MKIVEDPEFRQRILDKIVAREFNDRSGIHSSDLNYCLNKAVMRKVKPLPNTDEEILIFSMGWATQYWLTEGAEETPHILDGIIVTPDNEDYDGIPWELKATYQSSNNSIEEKNLAWIRQIMSQCKVMGTTEARLTRFEIMGDWKWVYGYKQEKEVAKRPTLHAYHLYFTQHEIDHNWNWMLSRKKLYEQVMETGQLLPPSLALPTSDHYECKWCPYTEQCEEGEIHYEA